MNINKYLLISAILFIGFFGWAKTSSAKNLYVNNPGSSACSDATTYVNNNASSPWCTIGRAAWGNTNRSAPNASQAAQAGDEVLISAGTYNASASSNQRYDPAYNPANSGTSGNPITFKGIGAVILRSTNGNGPVIGALNRNYIVWDHFYIDEAYVNSVPDTGPVVFWTATYSEIKNSTIVGRGDINRGDNYPGIRLENCKYITIRNNLIYNFGPNEGHNSAGIMTYTSGGLLAENNEIYGCGSAIFLKGNTSVVVPDGNGNRTWNTIRKNYIHDCPGGVNIHRSHQIDQLQSVTQNIFKNITGDEGAVKTFVFEDLESDPNNVKVVNNTIIDSLHAFNISDMITSPSNNVFWNNIVHKSSSIGSVVRLGWGDNHYNGLAKTKADFEHNLYYNSPYQLTGEAVASLSLATWKATYRQDAASPATITSDPLFVSYATGNYRLQGGSPALTLGVDILDLDNDGSATDIIPAGAYITGNETIGLISGGAPPVDTTPPAPPINVTII